MCVWIDGVARSIKKCIYYEVIGGLVNWLRNKAPNWHRELNLWWNELTLSGSSDEIKPLTGLERMKSEEKHGGGQPPLHQNGHHQHLLDRQSLYELESERRKVINSQIVRRKKVAQWFFNDNDAVVNHRNCRLTELVAKAANDAIHQSADGRPSLTQLNYVTGNNKERNDCEIQTDDIRAGNDDNNKLCRNRSVHVVSNWFFFFLVDSDMQIRLFVCHNNIKVC